MARKANQTRRAWRPNPPDPTARFRWQWLPHERKRLQPFSPGESGQMGGLQKLVNRLWAQTDQNGWCEIDAWDHERVQYYCRHYGPGAPNDLLREICSPAYRRTFGIELSWS